MVENGKKYQADFKVNEYHKLMELLVNKHLEDFFDFKSRTWFVTCHIELLEGNIAERTDEDEGHTLSQIDVRASESRLACQITVSVP